MSYEELLGIIAALPVAVPAGVVEAREPDEFLRAVDSVECPVRLLLASTEDGTHTLVLPGNGRGHMTWVIQDLFLFRPVEEGLGWLEVGYSLNAYVDSYATALIAANFNASTGLCSVSANLEQAAFRVGVFTYSERKFYGVQAMLSILQYVT